MADETQDPQNTRASDNSVATGNISIQGSVGGNFVIGNTGYTAEQVSTLITQISTTFQPKPFDGRSPYKGLDYFEEEDAELFFGREQLVDDLVGRLKESRTLFVTGPSGSGKSSLARAGLIYALKGGCIKDSERWLYGIMKPGREPIAELARVTAKLARSTNAEDEISAKAASDPTIFRRWCEIALGDNKGQRAVLFIDQFEEVFTQIGRETANTFIDLLEDAVSLENGQVILLFAMRSDFVSNCATFPKLNALLNRQFVQIGGMQPEELVSAIAQPALRVGLRIDPDLIAQIINDMRGEPGALPLMQFALKDLFDAGQAKGGVIALTLNNYLQRGGIRKALERYADDSFNKLDSHEQDLARSIFSGLIEIGRGTQDTRRTAIFDELVPANAKAEEVETIVRKLADARLITTDEIAGKDTVTISHEKLIDAWPWLKKLVNENRDVIALQNEIAADAKEWEEHGRDASYLYAGARLLNAIEQLKTNKLVLSGTALDYIRAGQARQRRSRLVLVGSVSLLIGLLVIALVIFNNLRIAALEQKNIAVAGKLAALAQQLAPSRPQTAALLAVQSMRMLPSIEAAQVLQTSSFPRPVASLTHNGPVHSVAFSPDGKYAVSEGCDRYDEKNVCVRGSARVWQSATGQEVSHLTFNGEVFTVAFSPNGKYVVSEGCDKIDAESNCTQGSARVWETLTGREIAHLIHEGWVRDVAFSPNGNYIVSGSEDKTARVWEVATGKEIARVEHGDMVSSVAFSPDGKYVLSGSQDRTTRVWEAMTGTEKYSKQYEGGVLSAAFSPDGKYIAAGEGVMLSRNPCMCGGGGATYLSVWEALSGKEIFVNSESGDVTSVAFSSDGKYVASGSNAGATVWEAATGKEIARMEHDGPVSSVAFSRDGKYVLSGGGTTARVWEAATGREIIRMTHEGYVTSVAFSPDGKYAISGSQDGAAIIWPVNPDPKTNRTKEIDNSTYSITFSPDGKSYLVMDGCQQTGQQDQCLRSSAHVVSVDSGNVVPIVYEGDSIYDFKFNQNGNYLISSEVCQANTEGICVSNPVRVWAADTGKEAFHMDYPGSLSFSFLSPDGNYVAAVGCEAFASDVHCSLGSILVGRVKPGKEVAHIQQKGEPDFISFSDDGKYAAWRSCDQLDSQNNCKQWSAHILETATGKELSRIPFGTGSNRVLSGFSSDGKYILSPVCEVNDCSHAFVAVWEAATGKEVVRMPLEGDTLDPSNHFSPDGKYVVSTGCTKRAADYLCRQGFTSVWELATQKEIARAAYEGVANSFSFSSNGKVMILGGCERRSTNGFCRQGSARAWALDTGKELAKMIHEADVTLTALSPDGSYAVSAGQDGTARLWETATGKEITRITYAGGIDSVLFSQDGKYIISEGCVKKDTVGICLQDSIRVWMYRPEDLIADVCSRLTRNLSQDEWQQYVGDVLTYQPVCKGLPLPTEKPTATP